MADETNTSNSTTTDNTSSTENLETTENTEETESSLEEGEESQDASSEENKDGKEAKLAKEQKKEEKKSNKKKLKIKVDQKEEDVELDLDNEEELKKQIQLARVAQKRMSEMADLKKDVTELLNKLAADPFSVLGDAEAGLGLNVDDLVRQYVEKKLADAEKTPEQIAKEKMESELKALKEEREREKAEREREKYEVALQNEVIKYDNMMTKALENSEFKKPSPALIRKMSDYLMLAVQNKIDLTPEEILPLVRDDLQSEIKELINTAPEEVIEAMFGKEIFERMRKKHVAKAKKAPIHASNIKDTGTITQPKQENKPKISYKDYFK